MPVLRKLKTLIQKKLNIMTQTGGKLNYAH